MNASVVPRRVLAASRVIGGRLGFLSDGWAQRRATRRRHQSITIAGFTIKDISAKHRRSNTLASIALIASLEQPTETVKSKPGQGS